MLIAVLVFSAEGNRGILYLVLLATFAIIANIRLWYKEKYFLSHLGEILGCGGIILIQYPKITSWIKVIFLLATPACAYMLLNRIFGIYIGLVLFITLIFIHNFFYKRKQALDR